MAETNSRKLHREKGVGPHVALNLEARASAELRVLSASFPEQQRPGAAASRPWAVARGRRAGVVGLAPLRSPQTLWLESMWGAVSGLRATGQSPQGGHPSREGRGSITHQAAEIAVAGRGCAPSLTAVHFPCPLCCVLSLSVHTRSSHITGMKPHAILFQVCFHTGH